jgi:hypothetical protein
MSFDNLNKDLDEKIANIRKKYLETTDVLNKRNRTPKFNSRNYFKELNRYEDVEDYYN